MNGDCVGLSRDEIEKVGLPWTIPPGRLRAVQTTEATGRGARRRATKWWRRREGHKAVAIMLGESKGRKKGLQDEATIAF